MKKSHQMLVTTLMEAAIEKAKQGMANGQSPFGCAISINGKIIAVSHNSVVRDTDITAHAEINAIRQACKQIDNIFLSDAIVASTCEPCPMCMAALHWARVKEVYYGASISDAEQAGFNELQLPAADIVKQGKSSVILISGYMEKECTELFKTWTMSAQKQAY
ncbi:MAG: tRNA-specific adenosine deaminase [Moraxellaceae bacterium]|nr:MAG: tRNA-specific adenosine deaminase [Moraxellaceae bacterium]